MSSRRDRPIVVGALALALVAAAGCDTDDGRALAEPPPGATAPPRPTGTTTSSTVVVNAAGRVRGGRPRAPPLRGSLAIRSTATRVAAHVSPPLGWTGSRPAPSSWPSRWSTPMRRAASSSTGWSPGSTRASRARRGRRARGRHRGPQRQRPSSAGSARARRRARRTTTSSRCSPWRSRRGVAGTSGQDAIRQILRARRGGAEKAPSPGPEASCPAARLLDVHRTTSAAGRADGGTTPPSPRPMPAISVSTVTEPSRSLRAKPLTPSRCASRSADARNHTCTRPDARIRRRTALLHRGHPRGRGPPGVGPSRSVVVPMAVSPRRADRPRHGLPRAAAAAVVVGAVVTVVVVVLDGTTVEEVHCRAQGSEAATAWTPRGTHGDDHPLPERRLGHGRRGTTRGRRRAQYHRRHHRLRRRLRRGGGASPLSVAATGMAAVPPASATAPNRRAASWAKAGRRVLGGHGLDGGGQVVGEGGGHVDRCFEPGDGRRHAVAREGTPRSPPRAPPGRGRARRPAGRPARPHLLEREVGVPKAHPVAVSVPDPASRAIPKSASIGRPPSPSRRSPA